MIDHQLLYWGKNKDSSSNVTERTASAFYLVLLMTSWLNIRVNVESEMKKSTIKLYAVLSAPV